MNEGTSSRKPRPKKLDPSFQSSDEEDEPEVFDKERDYVKLINRPDFKNADTIVRMDASDFTIDYVKRTGLKNPIVFTGQKDILGIRIPTFSYREVLDRIPPGQKIDMFNHSNEKQRLLPVSTIVGELEKPRDGGRSGPFNMLSLECSSMKMDEHIDAPKLVRQLDWAQTVFPKEKFKHRNFSKVEKYILMTMAGSYTEFHVDFGGTSVWYHVYKGEKHFFLVEPDEHNFRLFEEWLNAYRAGTNTAFFGDVVEKCAVVKMEPGHTLILPSGWIHAVYTPVDSLVYGGNFLFEYSIPMQIQVKDYEARSNIQKKFTYPYYEQTLWYFAADLVQKATGREYVRLIKSTEYNDMIVKAREDSSKYCFNVELPEEDFYDQKTGDPNQTSFDVIDETNNPPPKYDDEYLRSIPREVQKNLYKVKDLLQHEYDVRKQRHGKIAEGIRRPKHLLTDLNCVIKHIDTKLYEEANTESTQPEYAEKPEDGKPETTPGSATKHNSFNISRLISRDSGVDSSLKISNPEEADMDLSSCSEQPECSKECKRDATTAPLTVNADNLASVEDRIASPRTSFGGKRKNPTSKERSKPKIKQSIASSKPPPKQRKEENMPLPTSSSAASEDDPVHMAIALGRRNDPRLKFGQLNKQPKKQPTPLVIKQISPIQQPSTNFSVPHNGNHYSPPVSSVGHASFLSGLNPSNNTQYYSKEQEPEFYNSSAIPIVPSASTIIHHRQSSLKPAESFVSSNSPLKYDAPYASRAVGQPHIRDETSSFYRHIEPGPPLMENNKTNATIDVMNDLLAEVADLDEDDFD